MKKNSVQLKLLICTLVFSVSFLGNSTISSFAANKYLSVPAYNQLPKYDSLCWATSASMITSYFKKDTTDRKVSIAKYIHGSTNFNKAGTIYNARDGVTKYAGKKGYIKSEPLTYKAVQHQINNNGPIAVGLKHKSGSGGHMVVLRGYDNIASTVRYNDPWGAKVKTVTYSYFKNNSSNYWVNSLFYK